MSKKTDGTNQEARQRMHELYMAHQAHTLAQMMFRQLASSWTVGQPWISPGGDVFAPPPPQSPSPAGCAPGFGTASFAPGAGSPLVYWYP
jgi:hypothetical protein